MADDRQVFIARLRDPDDELLIAAAKAECDYGVSGSVWEDGLTNKSQRLLKMRAVLRAVADALDPPASKAGIALLALAEIDRLIGRRRR